MKILLTTLAFIFSVFVLSGGLTAKPYQPSVLEKHKTLMREVFYYEDFGRIYSNRFGLAYFNSIYPSITKFESVFFSTFDSPLLFVPLYGALVYLGFKKNQ